MNSEGQTSTVEAELFEGEEIKFRAEGILAKLESNQHPANLLLLGEGSLCITTSRVVFAALGEKGQKIQLDFKKVVSHGIQENCLVCYLSGEEGQEVEDDEEAEAAAAEEEKSYLEFVKNQTDNIVCLQGDFELRFSFEKSTAEELKSAFYTFSECSALNPDEEDDGSQLAALMNGGDLNGFDFDSMVTAKDIDENGNLIKGHPMNEGEEDDEDDEDYCSDDENEGVEEEDQGNNNNNDKNDKHGMDLE